MYIYQQITLIRFNPYRVKQYGARARARVVRFIILLNAGVQINLGVCHSGA